PHWWDPAAREGAPDWEVLPQEARPGAVILSKRNELGLLSNFAATPFVFSRRALREPRRVLRDWGLGIRGVRDRSIGTCWRSLPPHAVLPNWSLIPIATNP